MSREFDSATSSRIFDLAIFRTSTRSIAGRKSEISPFPIYPKIHRGPHTVLGARLTPGTLVLRLDRAQDFQQDRQSDKRRRRSTMTAMKI
jgi:hypothetical protein